jgi:hypothetical protein
MTTAISSLVLGAPDLATAEEFYERLGLDDRIRVQQSDEPTSGFRGYTLSLVCAQPANVDAYVAAAVEAGPRC